MPAEPSNIELLETRLGANWSAIRKAHADTTTRRRDLDSLFIERNSPDTSVVVFGSVAREEVTSSSDLDWILLVDGSAVPEHKIQEREVERALAAGQYIEPGKSGVFGKMVGSVAKACLNLRITDATSRKLFDSYDRFLAILDDPDKRAELARAHTHEDLRDSKAWDEVRQVSRPFHASLIALFLKDDEDLKNLTLEYGVF